MTKATLIDPVAQTITEIRTETTLEALYAVLGCDIAEEVKVGIDQNKSPIVILFDEEGRYKNDQRCFGMGPDLVIAGRALVFGTVDGSLADCPVPLQFTLQEIGWKPIGYDYTPEIQVVAFDSFDELPAFLSGKRH